jgi:hypothetical protein
VKATNTVTGTFTCSIERAFRTPIHGDATKILYGFGPVPPVIGFAQDETWGKTGGTRIPLIKGNWMVKEGAFGLDEIFVRDELKYWKWGVRDLGPAMFFATHNEGEWWCTDHLNGTIGVKWKYTYYAKNIFTQIFNWLFVKLVWRKVMKNGLTGIQEMAEKDAPFLYS